MSDTERFASPYELMGGRGPVERLAHAFYDAMEEFEPELTALHDLKAPGKVSDEVRAWFASFLVMWTGGPDDYMNERGHPRLRWRHSRVPVNNAMRDAWLRAMSVAMDRCEVQGPVREYLNNRFTEVADFLRNREG